MPNCVFNRRTIAKKYQWLQNSIDHWLNIKYCNSLPFLAAYMLAGKSEKIVVFLAMKHTNKLTNVHKPKQWYMYLRPSTKYDLCSPLLFFFRKNTKQQNLRQTAIAYKIFKAINYPPLQCCNEGRVKQL